MSTGAFSNHRVSTVVHFLMLLWTFACFIGTWFIIIQYKILFEGFIAMVMTFFFGAFIWMIPLGGLIILSLFVSPKEEEPQYVTFRDLIKKGMKSQKSIS
jgi:hypothetical protein